MCPPWVENLVKKWEKVLKDLKKDYALNGFYDSETNQIKTKAQIEVLEATIWDIKVQIRELINDQIQESQQTAIKDAYECGRKNAMTKYGIREYRCEGCWTILIRGKSEPEPNCCSECGSPFKRLI